MSFHANVFRETEKNLFFRKVIFTGKKSQLVVMEIPPGGDIGQEVHKHVEQSIFFLSGTGTAILDGVKKDIKAGDVVVVTPGTQHNISNNGKTPLKVFTVYAPANHIDGTVHKTKADSDVDLKDEAFGEKIKK